MPTAPCFYIRANNEIVGQLDLIHFPFTIGRARECDYVIDSNDVSRIHLQLDFLQQNVVLRDLGSTNGTFLNGEALRPHKDYRLRANDTVSIANICELVFDDPATTAQLDYERYLGEGLRLDEAAAQVYINNQPLDPPLSPSQILLLQLLLGNEGIVVTRDSVREHVWGGDQAVTDQAIDALVSRLRKRLHETDPEHEYLVTRRGFGLIFHNRHYGFADSSK